MAKPSQKKVIAVEWSRSDFRYTTYQPLEACDDLKCDPSSRSFLRNRVGRRGLTPIGKGTNQIYGDTVNVAETGKKMPV
jgi:hypothetical protein